MLVSMCRHRLVFALAVLAALAMPGQGSARTLGARRALRGNLFEGAAVAQGSQLAAGWQAAASQAGAEAGRATRQFFTSLLPSLVATPSPTAAPDAATTVANSPHHAPGPAKVRTKVDDESACDHWIRPTHV